MISEQTAQALIELYEKLGTRKTEALTGVSRSTVSKIVNGKRDFSPALCEKITGAVNACD